MAVAVSSDPVFTPLRPTKILGVGGYFFEVSGRSYDVSGNGERFLVIERVESVSDAAPASILVVQNWFEELKRRVPTP